MIRVVFYLLIVAVVALGAAWLADRPGDVAITWQGWRIETSVAVTAVALALAVALAIALWSLLRTVLRSPDLISMLLRDRRGLRGYQAISRGLVAIGAGDREAARKFAEQANRIAPGDPLVLLLSAQTAQLSGDRNAAERAFRAMTMRDDTKLLGLRGLFMEAQRRGDAVAASAYAEEAAKTAPGLGWAGQAVLEFRCAAGDWVGALAALESNAKAGLVDKAPLRRQRAVLLVARALALEETDRDQAKELALEAVKLAPTLVPASVLAGRRLAEAGELRKAAHILEKAWKVNPHPDIAETYANLRFGDSARDRLARVETLARAAPGHVESALALAQAALDALDFAKARAALRPLLSAPTQRVAMLMARIEQREHGDEGRAREWTARAVHAARDPVWTADGIVSDRWLPVSPVTDRLDAFAWKVALEQLAGPVVEQAAEALAEPDANAPLRTPAAASAPAAVQEGEPGPPRQRGKSAFARGPEPVIPLVHVPDDPGPMPEAGADPQPDAAWQRPRPVVR